MISSTRILPDGYRQTGEIDLAKNKGLAIMLNVVGALLFFLSLVLLGWLLRWARPELVTGTFSFQLGPFAILGSLASIALMLLVHELIHGLFFWIFTRQRPVFALRPLYAYAAAPDWFIPARQYSIIGLAPLVLIDAIGMFLIFLAPAGWVALSILLIAMNTGGSVGDLYIVARLAQSSPGSFANDTGDRVRFFEPAAAASTSD